VPVAIIPIVRVPIRRGVLAHLVQNHANDIGSQPIQYRITSATALRLVSPARLIMSTPSAAVAIWRHSAKPSRGGESRITRSYSFANSSSSVASRGPIRSAARWEPSPAGRNSGSVCPLPALRHPAKSSSPVRTLDSPSRGFNPNFEWRLGRRRSPSTSSVFLPRSALAIARWADRRLPLAGSGTGEHNRTQPPFEIRQQDGIAYRPYGLFEIGSRAIVSLSISTLSGLGHNGARRGPVATLFGS
jgi:hypothetical protein